MIFFRLSDCLRCSQCYNYNGQVCVNAPDCTGNYCLFEETTSNGITTVKKTCLQQAYYQLDDNTYVTDTEACLTRQTPYRTYKIKICKYADNCNNQCSDGPIYPPMTTQIPFPPDNTFPPITNGLVNCYSCTDNTGHDCKTGNCQGRYCLYERRLTGNQIFTSKSCLEEPIVKLDDGTVVNAVDVCELRNTAESSYYIKICQDINHCNGYCIPGEVDPQKFRQPLLTCPMCDAMNSNDCYSGQTCQGNYCFYEHQRNLSSGIEYVRKGCSIAAYIAYPDSSTSKAVNSCEYRTFGNVEFQVKVCNSGGGCNTPCQVLRPSNPTVSCTQCIAYNTNDCTGTTCVGTYCISENQAILGTGESVVIKNCTNSPTVTYPDKTLYSSKGICEYKQINGNSYAVKLCDSNNCNYQSCSSNYYTSTHQPSKTSSHIFMILPLFITLYLSSL
ncbi:unnamed protein product [Auanema sp. JU1783]|nr:unnamed protein product [Auanema sp. JU1783]